MHEKLSNSKQVALLCALSMLTACSSGTTSAVRPDYIPQAPVMPTRLQEECPDPQPPESARQDAIIQAWHEAAATAACSRQRHHDTLEWYRQTVRPEQNEQAITR